MGTDSTIDEKARQNYVSLKNAVENFWEATEKNLEKKINGLNVNYELPLREAQKEFEKSFLESQLFMALGDRKRVAENTGWGYSTIRRKIKELGINPKEYDIRSDGYKFKETRGDAVKRCIRDAALEVLPQYYSSIPMHKRLEALIKNEGLPMAPKLLDHEEALRNFNQRYIYDKAKKCETISGIAHAAGVAPSTLSERIKNHCVYLPNSENEQQLKNYSQ